MFNVGSGEMLVIFLLALLVLGPERLPKAMGQVGRAVAQMRRLSSGFQDEIRRAMDPIEAPFRPGEQTLQGPVPSITDEVRVVNAEPGDGPVSLDKPEPEGSAPDAAEPESGPDAPELEAVPDADIAVEPATQAPVVDPEAEADAPGTVTPLRPRDADADADADGDDDDGDRATG